MAADTQYYAIGKGVTTTGTVAVTAGSASVVGTSTHFVDEVQSGDVLIIAGQVVIVNGPAISETALAIKPVAAASGSGLSFTAYDMHTTLLTRGVPFPKGLFTPYSQPLDLGDGSLRGGGWPTAEWHWGFLTRDQRNALRLLQDPSALYGASALVFIRTSQNESSDAFYSYQAQALWPTPEAKDAQRRPGFALKFRALVKLSVPD